MTRARTDQELIDDVVRELQAAGEAVTTSGDTEPPAAIAGAGSSNAAPGAAPPASAPVADADEDFDSRTELVHASALSDDAAADGDSGKNPRR